MTALPIFCIILALAGFYLGHRQGGTLRAVLQVFAVLVLFLGGFTGTIAAGRGDLVGVPMGDPAETVDAFFRAVQQGDYAAAENLLQGGALSTGESEDAALQRIAQTERESLQYALVGDCAAQGRTAEAELQVQYFDVEAMLSQLPYATERFLSAIVQDRPLDDVMTAGGAYASGVPEEAYDRALDDSFSRAVEFIRTEKLTVQLRYGFGGWKLQADEALLRVIGGVSTGENREALLRLRLDEAKETSLTALPLFRKQYSLPETATAGMKPNPACYGETDQPQVILQLAEDAKFLMDGQSLSWNPDIERMPGSTIRYYCDESILALSWKEVRNGSVLTFGEVKLADPSQIRRVLCQDTYGSMRYEKPSHMARRTNSVLAINGDFYRFRGVGISVYQGEVYRRACGIMDTCFVDGDGRLRFTRRDELSGAAVDAFVEEHDVNFAVTFGPILIEDGQLQDVSRYGIGEVHNVYPRSALGWVDDLHYIVLALNAEGPYQELGKVSDMGPYMQEKGCVDAYELDGGRSTAMCMGGRLINEVNLGGEKPMSDMIYFASAVPEEDW